GLGPGPPRRGRATKGSRTAGGNPSGKVAKGRSMPRPAIPQCPVVVSFPAEASTIFPNAPAGWIAGGTPRIIVRLPRPYFCRYGRVIPPTARDVFPRVSEPSFP